MCIRDRIGGHGPGNTPHPQSVKLTKQHDLATKPTPAGNKTQPGPGFRQQQEHLRTMAIEQERQRLVHRAKEKSALHSAKKAAREERFGVFLEETAKRAAEQEKTPAPMYTQEVLLVLDKLDREWTEFQAKQARHKADSIRASDVPYPTESELHAIIRVMHSDNEFKALARRYHPDKFQQIYGDRVNKAEYDLVMELSLIHI
eukprot:TRINITY_DN13721_c0_g1_i1.p2 TRINITY_DN13721_c0_g1~~TRINITY_DN13721_c0_g1_i1.p2  ORF type:complete len:202 (+),score=71.13 TRINITY_DN13721_c0_g1_i1:64-669(+)